jgi:hypothetical protein
MKEQLLEHQIYRQGCYMLDRFLIADEGVILSEARLIKNDNNPIFYHLASLETNNNFRQRGLATKILRQVNLFLEQNHILGILENQMLRNNPSHEIYKKNGWQESEKYSNWMFYNKAQDMGNQEIYNVIEFLINEKIADDFDFPEIRIK